MNMTKKTFLGVIMAVVMVFAFAFALIMPTTLTAYAAGSYSVGFAIKEATEVYFAETGNNKVQNTATGNDGKIAHMPELYRTDTLDFHFDGWFIANTDTRVTEDTVLDSDVTLVDRWTYTEFDENYKVSEVTIKNPALALGTKQGEYTADVAVANVDGITLASGKNFVIYKGLNKSGDPLEGDEEVEIGKNYSVVTTIKLKDGFKFDDQIRFYADNGLAADWKFRGNFWTTRWTTEATQVEVVINFVQSDDYYFIHQPESREFENFTEYHYYYLLNEESSDPLVDLETVDSVQLQYYSNDTWTLFGPATMVVSPYQNRTIKFRLVANYEHGTIYSDPWTITWAVLNPTIDDVALGIDTPANGNAPTYAVSTGSRFKLASTNNSVTKNGVKWTGSVSGELEVGNATFNNSEDYTVSITLVAQEGYSFDVANMTATINAQEATVTGTSEEVTVSYTFEKAAPKTYNVYFNPSVLGTGTMETAVVNEGAEYTLPECTFTPNANYEFSAWCISGILKKPDDVIVVNSDENVFAVWQASSTPASYGFVTQPTGGTVAAGAFFTASFEVDNGINYKDVSVLEYDEKTGNWNTYVGNSGYIHTSDNGKIIKIGFESDDTSSKILRLSANRDGISVALSDTFTVNWTPSEFTKQPQGATVVNGSTYTFTWDTTFDARFRILYWDTEENDWDGVKDGETTGHSFSVKQDTTQSITYKVVADIPYTMSNGATNYSWEVATSQSFIVSWVEALPTKYTVYYGVGDGQGSGDSEEVEEGTEYTLDSYEHIGMFPLDGQQFAYWSIRIGNPQSEETAQMQPGGKITITADTYIIAIWQEVSHAHSLEAIAAKAATCTAEGNIAYWHCTECDKYFSDENGENEITLEETVLEKVAHTVVNDPAVPATCTESGLTAGSHCSVCGTVLAEQEVVPALGHTWGDWQVVTPATETEEGLERRVCSRDNDHVDQRSIPVIGHKHTIVAVAAKAATCDVAGESAHYECTACHRYFSDAEGTHEINTEDFTIAALGHEWGEWIVTTPAQIGVKGIETRTCNRDHNHTESREIAALPYEYKTVDGVKVYAETLVAGQAKDLGALFAEAKAQNGKVALTVGNLSLTFDANAVNTLGGETVSLTANVLTENLTIDGAQLVIDITLTGASASFGNGKVTVSVPFTTAVPEGKVAKVYYVNGNDKTDMNAVFADGKVTFETPHFSTFAVVFEDEQTAPVDPTPSDPEVEPTPAKKGLSGGAIAGIVIAIVAVLAGAGVGCFFLLKKKGGKKTDEPKKEDEPKDESDK